MLLLDHPSIGRLNRPCRLDPSTPAGLAELLLRGRIDHARGVVPGQAKRDLGASVVEWVIISALVVGIAAAVGTILLRRLRDKANSIDLDQGGTGGGGTGGGGGGGGVP